MNWLTASGRLSAGSTKEQTRENSVFGDNPLIHFLYVILSTPLFCDTIESHFSAGLCCQVFWNCPPTPSKPTLQVPDGSDGTGTVSCMGQSDYECVRPRPASWRYAELRLEKHSADWMNPREMTAEEASRRWIHSYWTRHIIVSVYWFCTFLKTNANNVDCSFFHHRLICVLH